MTPSTHNIEELNSTTLVNIAREVAMNIFEIETILKRYKLDERAWERLKRLPYFDQVLRSAQEEWDSAFNTQERVKVKSAAMIEMWLDHASTLLHADKESTREKTELAKFIARLGSMGMNDAQIQGGAGERISVVINLGSDQLKFEKDITPRVIEHDSNDASRSD